MAELVSVIIPVYKVEKYLEKCVRSVMNQTYGELEIILVDDGSPDNCPQLCDALAREDARIRVIHRQNGGLSAARNTGLEAAKGEWLMFPDSDDWLDPEAVFRLLDALHRYDAQIAIGGIVTEYEDGAPELKAEPLPDAVLSGREAITLLCSGENFSYVMANVRLYARSIFSQLRFPEGRIHEDEFTAHRIYGLAKRVVSLSAPCYHYLQRAGSITAEGFSVKRLDRIEAYFDRFCWLREQGYAEEAELTFRRFILFDLEAARDFTPETPQEKARFREIRELSRRMARLPGMSSSAGEKFAMTFPQLWKKLYRLKR